MGRELLARGATPFANAVGPMELNIPAIQGIGGSVIFSEDITQRKIAEREIVQRNQELEHFNRAATGRELRMIALKRQVNELARAAGRPAPYDVTFADAAGERPGP